MLIQNESIETEYKSLLDFGFEKKLIIPRIQRSYVWKESNLVDIKNELTKYIENENDEQNNDAFLMPMSAYDGETTRSICDGQQRLITINMLRALCKKYYEDNGDYDKAKEIRIFDIRYEDEDEQIRPNQIVSFTFFRLLFPRQNLLYVWICAQFPILI